MTETLQRFIPGATVGSGSSGVTGILFTGKRLFVDDIAISSTRLDRSYQVIPGAAIAGVLGSFTGPNVVADAGNRVRYFHYNDLGTVMAQTKANATVEGVWEPNWCGNYRWRYSASPARPELGLTGKMYDDEAGLYYFNARWYDPERGRWMSEEPLGLTDRIFVGCLMAGVAAVGWAPSALADNDIIIVGGQTDPDQTIIDFVLSVASGPTSITYDTGAAFGGTLTPDDIDRLNQADLIIVTRYAASGTYNNQTWNTSVTTPIILMSSYISRANRWNWFPTSDLTEGNPGTANARNTTFTSVNVLVPDDPAFTVTPLDVPTSNVLRIYNTPWLNRHTIARATSLTGTVVLTAYESPVADSPVLVRWTGSESSFYVGGTSAPAGPRVFFCIQDDNNRLEDGTTVVDQVADMTPEGLILFRNVLASLVPTVPVGMDTVLIE